MSLLSELLVELVPLLCTPGTRALGHEFLERNEVASVVTSLLYLQLNAYRLLPWLLTAAQGVAMDEGSALRHSLRLV